MLKYHLRVTFEILIQFNLFSVIVLLLKKENIVLPKYFLYIPKMLTNESSKLVLFAYMYVDPRNCVNVIFNKLVLIYIIFIV